MRIKRALKMVFIGLIISLLLTGCGGGPDQSSMENATKSFVQALIDSNEEGVDAMNKSNPVDFPTTYLMNGIGKKFPGYKLDDFTFTPNQEKSYVEVKSADGKINYKFRFKQVEDSYYFMGLVH